LAKCHVLIRVNCGAVRQLLQKGRCTPGARNLTDGGDQNLKSDDTYNNPLSFGPPFQSTILSLRTKHFAPGPSVTSKCFDGKPLWRPRPSIPHTRSKTSATRLTDSTRRLAGAGVPSASQHTPPAPAPQTASSRSAVGCQSVCVGYYTGDRRLTLQENERSAFSPYP